MAVQLRHGLIGRVDLKTEQSGRYKQTVAYFDLDGEPMVYQGEYIPYVGPRTPIPPGFEQGEASRVFWRLFRLSHATISRVSTVA